MKRIGLALLPWLLFGCFDLALPAKPPPPGPGTVQGTVVYAVSGRTTSRPAGGARIQLVNTTLETAADLESGRFVLEGITQSTGLLLITFDADRDGVIDRQKLLDLTAIKAGPGRDVALGDVGLGRNAELSGKVLLADVAGPNGHFGTTVFVPNAPFVTVTGDDGTFLLENLPEGPTQVGFFHLGYTLETRELELSGGQESRLTTVTVTAVPPGSMMTSDLSGVARLANGQPAANAVVRIAADGLERTTTSNSEGRFTFTGLPVGVYQLAIEIEGSRSLRIYNVLVGEEDADLGTVTLTPGMSTRVELDGGLSLNDLPPNARIVQNMIDVDPGQTATLSGLTSSGDRPLVYHWRSDAGITFSPNDSAIAGTTTLTAPPTAQTATVSLTVSDVSARNSLPAFASVRVSSRPTVKLVASVPNANSGDTVTYDATATSTDGQTITGYRWSTVGPLTIPEVVSASGPKLVFVAPQVASDTQLLLRVVAVTALGPDSLPATQPIQIRPGPPDAGWSLTATASLGSPINVNAPNTINVQLMAITSMPPPQPVTYSWAPISNCFTLPDGGAATPCVGEDLFELSGATNQTASFFAPMTDRTFAFTVTVTAAGISKQATVNLTFIDTHQPVCTATLSQIALRVACNRPMLDAGTVAPFAQPLQVDPVDPTKLSVKFHVPLAPDSMVPFTVTGLTDTKGKTTMISSTLPVQYGMGSHFRTQGTSSKEPRPGWVYLRQAYGRSQNRLVGRRVAQILSTDNRMVWSLPLDFANCSAQPCVLLDQTDSPIPGAGNTPRGKTAFMVGDYAYVSLSNSAFASVMELRPAPAADTWSELMATPDFISLGTDGTTLSAIAPVSGGPGLMEHRYDSVAKTWGNSVAVDSTNTYNLSSASVLNFGGGGAPVVIATDPANIVKRFGKSGATWSPAPMAATPTTTELRAVSLGSTSLVLIPGSGDLRAYGTDRGGNFNVEVFGAPVNGFDIVNWGSTAMVAFGHNSRIYVYLFDPATRAFNQVFPNSITDAWNSDDLTPFYAGEYPQLTLVGDTVGMAWQEVEGPGIYRMAGKLIY